MQLAGPSGRGVSQCSGNDGEGQDGAAGLQLQGRDEALGGGGGVSLSLQDFPQAVPHVMSRAEDKYESWSTHTHTHPCTSVFVRTFVDIKHDPAPHPNHHN